MPTPAPTQQIGGYVLSKEDRRLVAADLARGNAGQGSQRPVGRRRRGNRGRRGKAGGATLEIAWLVKEIGGMTYTPGDNTGKEVEEESYFQFDVVEEAFFQMIFEGSKDDPNYVPPTGNDSGNFGGGFAPMRAPLIRRGRTIIVRPQRDTFTGGDPALGQLTNTLKVKKRAKADGDDANTDLRVKLYGINIAPMPIKGTVEDPILCIGWEVPVGVFDDAGKYREEQAFLPIIVDHQMLPGADKAKVQEVYREAYATAFGRMWRLGGRECGTTGA